MMVAVIYDHARRILAVEHLQRFLSILLCLEPQIAPCATSIHNAR